MASGPDEVVRQPERVYYIDERDGRERERQREPGHHAERPSPPAGHAGRERHRQHGQHARRHRGRRTGDEREDDQQCHSRQAGRRVRPRRHWLPQAGGERFDDVRVELRPGVFA